MFHLQGASSYIYLWSPPPTMEELPAGTVVSLGRNQLLFRLHPGLYSCPHCHVDLATRKPDLSCSNFAWIDSSFALMTSCSGECVCVSYLSKFIVYASVCLCVSIVLLVSVCISC